MFVRVTTTPNSPRKAVKIVENTRYGDEVRQKVVRHVGIAMDEDEVEKLKHLAAEICVKLEDERSKQGQLLDDNQQRIDGKKKGRPRKKAPEELLQPHQVVLSDLKEERRVIEGIDLVFTPLFERLGFHQLLKEKDAQLLKNLVLARLECQDSKRATFAHLTSQGKAEGHLNQVYRLMDKLHDQIPTIQQNVFQATRTLFPERVNILYFDVTTLYFESFEEDSLRRFGYSKDQKYHMTQVVLALATNDEGLPYGYKLFSGNQAEVGTLLASLSEWQSLFSLGQVVFVADRAMMSAKNIAQLKAHGVDYVIASPLRKLSRERQDQVLSQEGYRLALLDGEPYWVNQYEDEAGDRLIVSYSARRAQKDQKDRQKLIDKIEKKLSSGKSSQGKAKKLISNQGYLKYVSFEGKDVASLNEERIQKDAQWDGLHGVCTSLQNESALEILALYRRLWVIEDSFRLNKTTLKIRPIYHWTPERIETHIALCYMSFALLRHAQYQMKICQKAMPIPQMLTTLRGVQASIHKHTSGQRFRMPGSLTNDAKRILKAFGVAYSESAEAIP